MIKTSDMPTFTWRSNASRATDIVAENEAASWSSGTCQDCEASLSIMVDNEVATRYENMLYHDFNRRLVKWCDELAVLFDDEVERTVRKFEKRRGILRKDQMTDWEQRTRK